MEKSVNANPVFALEMQEIVEKLKLNGYGELIECLMDNETECYTKKGRLNKSATCRKTGLKTKELEDKLRNMRELLSDDFHLD